MIQRDPVMGLPDRLVRCRSPKGQSGVVSTIMRVNKKVIVPLAFVTTVAGIVAVFAGWMIPVIALGGFIAALVAGTRARLRPLLVIGLLALFGWGSLGDRVVEIVRRSGDLGDVRSQAVAGRSQLPGRSSRRLGRAPCRDHERSAEAVPGLRLRTTRSRSAPTACSIGIAVTGGLSHQAELNRADLAVRYVARRRRAQWSGPAGHRSWQILGRAAGSQISITATFG